MSIATSQKIANSIQALIESGAAAPGIALPPVPALCRQYGASSQDVQHALQILQDTHCITADQEQYFVDTFQPNFPASNTKIVISVITPFMNSYVFPQQIDGIQTILRQHNSSTYLGATYRKLANEEKILQSILKSPPDGIIAEPTSSALPAINAPLYQEILDRGIPLLFLNTNLPELSVPFVSLNDRRAGFLATKHLVEMGHRQIAYIGKLDSRASHRRFAGYANALSEAGIPLNEDHAIWFPSNDWSEWFTPALIDYLLHKIAGCTAVFCHNDQIACTLIEVCRQKGMEIPEELSVVGVDDSEYSQQCVPPCTTVRSPCQELGAMAASFMLYMIRHKTTLADYLFDPLLIKRTSVKCLKGPSFPSTA